MPRKPATGGSTPPPVDPFEGDPVRQDFRNFVFVVWKHLGLPDPTPVQYDICDYLQHGPRRIVVEAFRGVGKSWLTSAFVCWNLLRDPQMKILVVSASKGRADDFTTFVMRLICEMPLLQHLRPREDQRNSKISFDVAPARADHAPSVKSVGITGQLAGTRADLIIGDDIEVPNNSGTPMMRDKLSESVKEFDAILKPEGRVVYLGTPQTEESLYNKLPERGYEVRVWPSEYPTDKERDEYGKTLAPMIADAGKVAGTPTDPKRFGELDLMERKASYGRSGYALQFMLSTRLSDADRYPLKLGDLIVMPFSDPEKGPQDISWGSQAELVVDLPNVGFSGDRWHRAAWIARDIAAQPALSAYTGSVLSIDPSGRGKDECAYAVVKILHGRLFLLASGGFRDGYGEDTLKSLAVVAHRFKVNRIVVEANFGDGMFNRLLTPVVSRIYPCTIEEVKHSVQKEKRIIDTLEPVLSSHRLVVSEEVIKIDWKSTQTLPQEEALKYQLFYQLTRITREKGALVRDDRLDALAIAVNYWVEHMSRDTHQAVQDHKEELLKKDLERFMENILGRRTTQETWFTLKGR